jgi:hypothetical protein
MSLPDAPTEDGTERDGFLSYAKEWHALAIGFGAGLAGSATGRWELLAVVAMLALGLGGASRVSKTVAINVKKEPWYALGGLIFGAVLGIAATTV